MTISEPIEIQQNSSKKIEETNLQRLQTVITQLDTDYYGGISFCDAKIILLFIYVYLKDKFNKEDKNKIKILINTRQGFNIPKRNNIIQVKKSSKNDNYSYNVLEPLDNIFINEVIEYIKKLGVSVEFRENKKSCSYLNLDLYLKESKYKSLYKKLYGIEDDEVYLTRVRNILRILNL